MLPFYSSLYAFIPRKSRPVSCCPLFLSKGGVPGGVLDGELVSVSGLFCKGGMQLKQILLGQGPKLIPPQLSQGGVGGGVHGKDPLLGWGSCCAAGVPEAGGGDGSYSISHCGGRSLPQSSLHSHSRSPHVLQPYSKSKRDSTFFFKAQLFLHNHSYLIIFIFNLFF